MQTIQQAELSNRTGTIPADTVGMVSYLKHYLPLTKPTISLLVVVTLVPTVMMASPVVPGMGLMFGALVGTYLASAAAAVFNHVLDADIDSIMQRTRSRPLPSGNVSSSGAMGFGVFLTAASLVTLWLTTTPLAAAVALAGIVFYALIYTVCLKKHTDQNIVIGGAAGAVGPLIGWAAVSGTLSWPAWILFLVIFLWTPPHFWALALKYSRDYQSAGVPMLPVTRGEETTRRQMLWYTLTLPPVISVLFISGHAGWIYFIPSIIATLYFCWLAFDLYRRHDSGRAMTVFHYSCLYLFVVFGSLAVDQMIWGA